MLSNIASGIRTLFGSAAPSVMSGTGLNSSTTNPEFWEGKMLTHFKRMDLNGDGYVSRNDFKNLIKSLATKGKLSEHRSFLMQRHAIQLWEDFWCCGEDKGFDYNLPFSEFLELMTNLVKLSDCKKELEEPLGLLFDIIDLDGNGLISQKEWTIYYDVVGLTEKEAIESFELCFSSKSDITKTDFINIGQYFFACVDSRHHSKHLWGPMVTV